MISPDNIFIEGAEIPDIFYGLKKKAQESPYYSDFEADLTEDKVKEAIYELEEMAENPYNSDYWRNFFVLLNLATSTINEEEDYD